MNPPHTKDADSLDFEVAARPRLMKFQKNWNSKKIHIKFQIVGMLAKGIYSKYIICNLNTDILVVFLIPKK
jgi:homoaconitase/3-isopropylmalate dehydratase large subunit